MAFKAKRLVLACFSLSVMAAHVQGAEAGKLPLVDTFDAVAARAAKGDRDAAAALFEQSKTCLWVRRLDEVSARLPDDRLDSYGRQVRLAARQKAESYRAICQGSERKVDTKTIYDIALNAAMLGDTAASACFVQAVWPADAAGVDPAKLDHYREASTFLASRDITKGDWRFVRAMASSSAGTVSSGYAAYIRKPSPTAQLRYARLLRLGAASLPGEDVAELDLSIRILSDQLAPDGVARADAWARDMYARYYVSASPMTQASSCEA